MQSSVNDLLRPLAITVHFDGSVTKPIDWEQACQALPHPATAGFDDRLGSFGLGSNASLRAEWPARPIIVGRWGWSGTSGPLKKGAGSELTGATIAKNDGREVPVPLFQPAIGERQRLGDLVLAAERPFGAGRIFVLADPSPLENDLLPDSYPFVGRLLGYLAQRGSSPQDSWRQAAALAALAGLAILLAARPTAWQIMLSGSAMASRWFACAAAADWSVGVLPDGRHGAGNFEQRRLHRRFAPGGFQQRAAGPVGVGGRGANAHASRLCCRWWHPTWRPNGSAGLGCWS